ncbi:MAG TPA: hypothetical protein VFN67_13830 [Polyangiales bacterium]|nr:hypothetical protein [Polyangiales bacterium]
MAQKLLQTLSLVSIALTSPVALAQGNPDPDANTRPAATPGAVPPIGPTDDPSSQPPAAAPGAPPPASAASDQEPPLDVKFELQSIREDHQGLQTDLENFKFQWQRERDLHTAITTRGLLITGVIQGRFGWIDQDTTNASTYGRRSGFDIGSAIVGFTGTLFKDYEEGRNLTYSLRYGASPQTAGNSFLNLLDASITYSLLPTVDRETPALTVTLGQQLLPFGLEVPASEELKPVIRNAEFTTNAVLGLGRRDIGLVIRGDLFPQMDFGYSYRQALIAYALGVVNGAGPNTNDDNDWKDVIGRVAFTVPSDYNSWLRQITIGATGYWGKRNTQLTDDAKTLSGKGGKQRYGIDFYYNHWPFGLTYEFIIAKDTLTYGKTLAEPLRTDVTARAHTATLFLSFGQQFVAGFRNQGRYDDWWPKTYQPFVRYDTLNRDVDTKDQTVHILTFGLNVFFAETTKLQINYSHRRDETNKLGPSNELFTQVQFGF